MENPMLKLEQVARAIAYELGVSPSTNYTDDDLNRMARAAVEALRDLPAAMLSEGYEHFDHGGSEAIWPAMIDAILSEKPE